MTGLFGRKMGEAGDPGFARQSRKMVCIQGARPLPSWRKLRYLLGATRTAYLLPLLVVLIIGGIPLVMELSRKAAAHEFGSDLLAGISIVTSVLLGEYLVGSIVVLMLSDGMALEELATRRASSVLDALAKRIPQTAHRKLSDNIVDMPLEEIAIGDSLVVFPHDICPVDGDF